MAVFKIEKNKDFTIIGNHHLRDRKLSLKAKGLLTLMLSLPEKWDYTLNGLATLNKDGLDTIRTTVNELEDNGYLIRKQLKDENGKFKENEYKVFEKPLTERPLLENPTTVKPISEKPTQLNTNISNTNKSNKEELNKYIEDEELNDLFIEFLKQRKKQKAINSERAINELLNKLKPYDKETQKEMINNALVNSWKSVYPIKNKSQIKEPIPEWFDKEPKKEEKHNDLDTIREMEELLKEYR